MEQSEKISVIIPVYKTEPYIRKCLDSVVSQTYKNLEIILVDDGSPDACGAICDEYAAKDDRVKVIHKENGGLSSARNAGLSIVTGDWIGWVDSDDYVDERMFELLYKAAKDGGADIAVCGTCKVYKNRRTPLGVEKPLVLDRDEAIEELLKNDRILNSMCDKIFRREIFEGIQFPEGRNFEDLAVCYKLFIKAKKTAAIPDALYYYIQRDDSIVGDTSFANRINHYKAAKIRCDDMKADFPQFRTLLLAQCAASAVPIWGGYYCNPKSERKKYAAEIKEISAFCKETYRSALECMSLGAAGNIILRLTRSTSPFAFAVSGIVSGIYKLKHGKRL